MIKLKDFLNVWTGVDNLALHEDVYSNEGQFMDTLLVLFHQRIADAKALPHNHLNYEVVEAFYNNLDDCLYIVTKRMD